MAPERRTTLGQARSTVNRTQLMVLVFFVCVWIGLVAITVFSLDVYSQTLKSAPGDIRLVEVLFLTALSIVLIVLGVGVLRRWRWTFWLILIAFLFGILRVPASVLQLNGLLPATGPGWYEIVQGTIGGVQFAIALAMLAGYRKAGPWADF